MPVDCYYNFQGLGFRGSPVPEFNATITPHIATHPLPFMALFHSSFSFGNVRGVNIFHTIILCSMFDLVVSGVKYPGLFI